MVAGRCAGLRRGAGRCRLRSIPRFIPFHARSIPLHTLSIPVPYPEVHTVSSIISSPCAVAQMFLQRGLVQAWSCQARAASCRASAHVLGPLVFVALNRQLPTKQFILSPVNALLEETTGNCCHIFIIIVSSIIQEVWNKAPCEILSSN